VGAKEIWFMFENPWDPAPPQNGYPAPSPADQAIFRVSGIVALGTGPNQGIGIDADDSYVESDGTPVPGSNMRGNYPSCTFSFDHASQTGDGYFVHGMVVNATQKFFHGVQVEMVFRKMGGRVVAVRFLFGPTQLLGFGYLID
jgi:hypothetical protein